MGSGRRREIRAGGGALSRTSNAAGVLLRRAAAHACRRRCIRCCKWQRPAPRSSVLSEARLPFISVMTDPTTGGVSASLAMLGDINIGEPKALIGFAGPRVIQQTVRETLPEGFQRSEFLLEHGALDMIVDRRELRDRIGAMLRLLTGKEPAAAVGSAVPPESRAVAGLPIAGASAGHRSGTRPAAPGPASPGLAATQRPRHHRGRHQRQGFGERLLRLHPGRRGLPGRHVHLPASARLSREDPHP